MISKVTERLTDNAPDHVAADAAGDASITAAPRFIDARRRGFLQGTAVVGAAAVAGQVQANDLLAVTEPEAQAEAPKSRGYRVTDHVRKYYDCARF